MTPFIIKPDRGRPNFFFNVDYTQNSKTNLYIIPTFSVVFYGLLIFT